MKEMKNRIRALVGVVGMTVGILGLNMTFTYSMQISASLELTAESVSSNIIDGIYTVGAKGHILNSQCVEFFAMDGFNMGAGEGMVTVAHMVTKCTNSTGGGRAGLYDDKW